MGCPQEWNTILLKLSEFKAELVLDFKWSFQDFKWSFQGFFYFYMQAQRAQAATRKVGSIFNPELTTR